MEIDSKTFEYGLGDEGYSILSSPEGISRDDLSTLTIFCKSVKWTPRKVDFPDEICYALVPLCSGLATLSLSQSSDDNYGRTLTISIKGTVFKNTHNAVKTVLSDTTSQLPDPSNFPLTESYIIDQHDLLNIHSSRMSPSRSRHQKIALSKAKTSPPQPANQPSQAMKHPSKKITMIGAAVVAASITFVGVYTFKIKPTTNDLQATQDRLKKTQALLETSTDDLVAANRNLNKLKNKNSTLLTDLEAWKDAANFKTVESVDSPNLLKTRIQKLIGKRMKNLSDADRLLAQRLEKLTNVIKYTETLDSTLENLKKEIESIKHGQPTGSAIPE